MGRMHRQRGRHRRPRRHAPVAVAAVLALVVVASAGGIAAWRIESSAEARSRRDVVARADAYLSAWSGRDWNAMRRLADRPPKDFTAFHKAIAAALRESAATYRRGGEPVLSGATATVPFDVDATLDGLGRWSYRSRLSFTRVGERWLVRWSPSTVHPQLRPGTELQRTRTWAARAPILARDGTALTVPATVYVVGVEPARIEDRAELLRALRTYAGADPEAVARALDAPGVQPSWFVPVATLSASRYRAVRAQLHPVPGTVFRTEKTRTLRSDGFAEGVVGSTGEVTADLLRRLGQPYQAGDVVGLSGLEYAFDRQLAGSPSGSVQVVDGRGRIVRTVASFRGREPRAVRTTLDVRTQAAAQSALSGVGKPAALVAMDTGTGDLRAVVSVPSNGFDRALEGRYPPGSTFKIVTSTALLEQGTTLRSTITCPPTVDVGGRSFSNFEGETFGTITFVQAFERSCNTAFIQLASGLSGKQLKAAADGYGFDSDYSIPVAVAGGQFPLPADATEEAAAAIGQGRVLASPVEMCSVAAAVASGAWHAPRLTQADRPVAPKPLDEGVAASLRTLMRAVVTSGTGAAADIPDVEVFGKTGTAEFGTAGQTHAWFVGFEGRLAFAVLVEGGGVGGEVAAPIAATFLRALT